MSSLPPPPPPPSGSVPPPPPPPSESGLGGVLAPAPAPSSSAKMLWIVAAVVVVAVAVGVGVFFATRSDDAATKGSAYPDEVRKNFLTSCDEGSNGQTKYCECVLAEFQRQYSLDEFIALEQRFTNGGATTELEAITQVCQGQITP